MSKILTLEEFYCEIDKHIAVAKGYTEIGHLDNLIKMCRLKPYEMLVNHKKTIKLHRWWADEFSSSLKIGTYKDHYLQIILNDPNIDRGKIWGTDLYSGLPLDKIYAMSKTAFIMIGKTIDWEDFYVIGLTGLDNYVRAFFYLDQKWTRCSPLMLRLDVLRKLTAHPDREIACPMKCRSVIIYPCVRQEGWLSYLPVPEEIKKQLPDNLIQMMEGTETMQK